MASQFKYDVFLSHNRQDKPWVREFARLLRDAGLSVFFDEDTIQPGEDILRALEDGLEHSRHVVLVLTNASLRSRWVALETATALYEDPDNAARTIIPILLESVEYKVIRASLRRLNIVDLSDPYTRNERLARVLKSLKVFGADALADHLWPGVAAASGVKDLSVASIADTISWGWSGERLLEELIKLDYETIEGLTPDHEGHVKQWAPVFTDHPDTWRLIITEPQKLVGYWHFVPLFEEELKLVQQGKLLDSDITTDKVRLFELPGHYDVYFVSLCIKAQFRRSFAVTPLLRSLLKLIQDLAQEQIFFKDVYANAYTDSGRAMCKSFDMKPLTEHVAHGTIYSRRVYPFPRLHTLTEFPDLYSLYGREFWDLKKSQTA